ncbi:hypothetical protein KUTeg_015134 [Tegillarca granosa]|uniref:RING-type domain-containing protein n=1 Tax=Tegillarca granosa TaxID=220873 RepID=A0ABQ9EUG8_TEGGR|nr:hypothetical protein KUTeg_015134 [Tegillarca granosa]
MNTVTIHKEAMQSEWMRISTFANFPLKSPVNTIKLAAAGFYYQNKTDEVTCFSCGRKYSGWKIGDDPMRIHQNISPHCRFVTGSQSGNIAVKQNGESFFAKIESVINGGEKPSDNSKGACGYTENFKPSSNKNQQRESTKHVPPRPTPNERPLVCKEDNRQSVPKQNSSKNQQSYEPLGISTERPVYPHYALTVVRTTSFRFWPKDKTQHPQDLAKAGFFYEGVGDRVRCFFCGGGLFHWDPEDVPFVEHAKWYPKCVFLRQMKGDDFIQQIQKSLHQDDDVKSKKQRETDVMSHPAVLSVIEMGINIDLVKKALLKVQLSPLSAEKLLLKVWEIESGNEAADDQEEKTKHGSAEKTEDASAPLETIIEENKYLKDRQLCKICLDDDVSIVFLPCGHLATCVDCSHALRKCPICRVFIKGTVKSIMS